MPLICPRCQRTNPPEALYCHHDGGALGAHPVSLDRTRLWFPQPFVFPGGRSCRTFDELALACLDDWNGALALLRQGVLSRFLHTLGRADLSRAAHEAAQNPDRDRGLDLFLRRLPTPVVTPPVLVVEPSQVNLGHLAVGQEGRLELHLANQGMGLLFGSIRSDSAWLSPSDSGADKLFQFLHEAAIPIAIRGRSLRASLRGLEARLTIASSGGNAVVRVLADVPIRPYPEGVLAGARSPRELAEKARDHPREAAELFAGGGVARWYADNGWIYPVQGSAAGGVAGVQQFFEALGMTRPPQVEISATSIHLLGLPGERLEHTLQLSTPEKRLIYASASSDQPWLHVEVVLQGRLASVVAVVESVPHHPGATLTAKLTVRANGRQGWVVPVHLAVAGRPAVVASAPVAPSALPFTIPDSSTADAGQRGGGSPVAEVVRLQRQAPPLKSHDFSYELPPPPSRARGNDFARASTIPEPVPLRETVAIPVADSEKDDPADGPRGQGIWPLVPVAFLVLALSIAFVRDLAAWVLTPGPQETSPGLLDSTPRLTIHFHDTDEDVQLATGGGVKPVGADPGRPSRAAKWLPSMRFGLVARVGSEGQVKRLTFEEKGFTNNTCVRVDGSEWLFGEQPFQLPDGGTVGNWPGRWVEREGKPDLGRGRTLTQGKKSVWLYDGPRIQITQTVGLIPGPQSRLLDTCLIHYRIDNLDTVEHTVGLRFLLDTFIGGNDGVPFLLAGSDRLCSTSLDIARPEEVPDFIQARETEDLRKPGTIAHLQLRLGSSVEPPGRVTLGAWPNPELAHLDPRCRQEKTLWEVPVLPIKTLSPADSAVVLYWPERRLGPGASREVGFTYGLGEVAAGEGGGQLAVTAGGAFHPGGEFTVTAYVNNPTPGQSVTLQLPEGLTLRQDSATQPVPVPPADAPSRTSPVHWKVKAGREGTYQLGVSTNTGVRQTLEVQIRVQGLFGN
jgi:hypothetical protein